MCRRSRSIGRGRGPSVAQEWNDPGPQEIPAEATVVVARIVDPAQSLRPAPRFQFRAGEFEQRPGVPPHPERLAGRHTGESPGSSASHQREQQGLELIVGVMRGHQRFAGPQQRSQRFVSRLAGRSLRSLSGIRHHGHPTGLVLDIQRVRDGAAVLIPCRRLRLQLMIDMNGAKSQ